MGPPASFLVNITIPLIWNLYSRYNEGGPLTAVVHMTLNRRGLNKYDLILGGAEVTAQFPLHKFLNLEHRENGSDDPEVVMNFKSTALTFRSNKSMTDWQPISTVPGLYVTNGATVDWDTNQVLIRFRLRASNYEEDPTPALML